MKLDRKQAARAYRAVRLVKSGSSIASSGLWLPFALRPSSTAVGIPRRSNIAASCPTVGIRCTASPLRSAAARMTRAKSLSSATAEVPTRSPSANRT